MPAYKDERTGKWYCKFYYTDWQGHKKQKLKRGFALQRDAKEYERAFLERMQGEPDMTFSALTDLYFADMAARLKPITVQNKRSMFNAHLCPAFGGTPINEITPAIVRRWQADMLGKGYAPTYLKYAQNQLSAAFNFAVKYYGLKENPCHKAGSMGRTKANAMKFWTREEYRQFIATQEDRPAERMAFQVLYWCGLRIGELLALTPADIDLDGRIMSISKTLQKVDGRYMVTTPKTEKSKREITLPAFLCDELAGYMKRLYGLKKKDRLFDFTKDKLRTDLIRGSKESGVPQIRLHDLRHPYVKRKTKKFANPFGTGTESFSQHPVLSLGAA